MDDLLDGCLPLVVVLVLFSLALLIAGLSIDSVYYGRKAFSQETACEAQRMESRRKLFSTTVVCVPSKTRQDTTTVQVR